MCQLFPVVLHSWKSVAVVLFCQDYCNMRVMLLDETASRLIIIIEIFYHSIWRIIIICISLILNLVTEPQHEDLQSHPHLGWGANLLDSFSLPHAGIWIGPVFTFWILYGILVHIFCSSQACRQNPFQSDEQQW